MPLLNPPHLRLGAGAPLVMLPGLSARLGSPLRFSRWMMHRQVRPFALTRSVWSIDRRSGLADGTTINDLAEDYARTIRSLFVDPVDVIGISTGGSIALQLAADYPDLVKRLVLVSSAHRLSDRGRSVQGATARLLRSGHPRRAAALLLANNAHSWLTQLAFGGAGLLFPHLVVGREDRDLLITLDAEDSFDIENRLKAVQAPTLIAGGARDRFYSTALFEATSARIPNCDLLLYRRAGHMSINGNPQLVRDIKKFFSDRALPSINRLGD